MESRARILLVDDDPQLRRTLSDILQLKGFAVRSEAGGLPAIELAKEWQPAVALIDLKLEDMPGLEVLREMKALLPRAECIVLTGHATKDAAIEAISLGAYSFLQKPYEPDQLLHTIRRAIEKRAADAELVKRAAHMALLNDIGRSITPVLELEQVLERTVQLVHQSFGYDHVSLFTLTDDGDELLMSANAGRFSHLIPSGYQIRLDQGMVGWVLKHGVKLLANNVQAEPFFINLYPNVLPTQAELSVPIRVEEKTLGVLDIQSAKPNAFEPSDVMAMETLADQVAAAIENARLYEAVHRELAKRERLQRPLKVQHAATSALAESDRIDEAIPKLLQSICGSLGWDRAEYWKVCHAAGVLRCAETWPRPEVQPQAIEIASEQASLPPDVGLLGRVWSSGAPSWIPDAGEDPGLSRAEAGSQADPPAALAFPVRLGSEILGVMAFFDDALHEPDPDLLEVLSDVGSQIGQFMERKSTEEALRESEQRYRIVAETANTGISIVDAEERLIYVNPAFAEMFGYSPENLSGINLADLMDPEEFSRIREETELRKKGLRGQYEVTMRRKDGEPLVALVASTPLDSENGKYEGALGVVTDITALRRAERESQQKAEDLALINALNSAANRGESLGEVLHLLLNELAKVFCCDYAAIYLLGERGDRLILQDLAPRPALMSNLQAPMHAAIPEFRLPLSEGSLHEEILQGGEARLIVQQEEIGDLIQELAEAARLPDEAGKQIAGLIPRMDRDSPIRSAIIAPLATEGMAIGLLSMYCPDLVSESDRERIAAIAEQLTVIIRRRQAEQKLEEHKAQLEEMVEQRTKELLAANEELEGFSYSVSHDLRAPLRAISGFSRILLEEHAPNLPPEAKRYLGLVNDNTRHMGQLIDNLLAFSRLSRQPLAKRRVDPGELARQALGDLLAEQEERQIQASIADLPACEADPTLLKQVFANLLGNAIKFTGGREPAVIQVGWKEEGGERVFFVKDNGVGFDMQYADKLFGVFQRLHRAEDFEGTGVGLAVVQRIVHRHGGRVWAEAAVDQGATFYFTI